MIPFDKCPICGGEVVEKKVEKILKGGKNTALVHVVTEVCLHCGERLYSKKTIELFESIQEKLEKQKVNDFEPIGTNYKVAI